MFLTYYLYICFTEKFITSGGTKKTPINSCELCKHFLDHNLVNTIYDKSWKM